MWSTCKTNFLPFHIGDNLHIAQISFFLKPNFNNQGFNLVPVTLEPFFLNTSAKSDSLVCLLRAGFPLLCP